MTPETAVVGDEVVTVVCVVVLLFFFGTKYISSSFCAKPKNGRETIAIHKIVLAFIILVFYGFSAAKLQSF